MATKAAARKTRPQSAARPAARVSRAVKRDEMLETIKAYAFHTIRIAEDEKEPPYVPVNVHGDRNGVPFDINVQIRRGEDVVNVPREAVEVLYNAVETRFSQKKKKSEKGGKVMVPRKVKSYDFAIIESYNEKIKEAEETVDGEE